VQGMHVEGMHVQGTAVQATTTRRAVFSRDGQLSLRTSMRAWLRTCSQALERAPRSQCSRTQNPEEKGCLGWWWAQQRRECEQHARGRRGHPWGVVRPEMVNRAAQRTHRILCWPTSDPILTAPLPACSDNYHPNFSSRSTSCRSEERRKPFGPSSKLTNSALSDTNG